MGKTVLKNYLFRKQSGTSVNIINAKNWQTVSWRAWWRLGGGGGGIGKLSFGFSNLLVPLPFTNKTNEKCPSAAPPLEVAQLENAPVPACRPCCQQQLKTAEWGPCLPSHWRGNEFNMCGKQGCSLRCCGTQGPGPQRKASAPACLCWVCWVCRERTSGEEAPAAPLPRPHAPLPLSTPLPSLSAESTWRQGAMSEHPDKTWALKTFKALKIFALVENFQRGKEPPGSQRPAMQVKASTGVPCKLHALPAPP